MIEFIDFLADEIILTSILVALIAMLVTITIKDGFIKYKKITPTMMVKLMNDKNTIVYDLRDKNARNNGYIQNSKVIPQGKNITDVLTDKDKSKRLIFYSLRGNTSATICNKLSKMGFDTYTLNRGYESWLEEKLPIVVDKKNK